MYYFLPKAANRPFLGADLYLYLGRVIAAILMPLSSITIVLFGVGASGLAARQLLKQKADVSDP